MQTTEKGYKFDCMTCLLSVNPIAFQMGNLLSLWFQLPQRTIGQWEQNAYKYISVVRNSSSAIAS